MEVEGEGAEPGTARFEFGLVHHGFCWAFPRQGGWSIGVGTFIGQQEADSEVVLRALLPSLGLRADASYEAIIEQYIEDCKTRPGYPAEALNGLK